MMRLRKSVAVASLACVLSILGLGGCQIVGSDYERAQVSLPETFRGQTTPATAGSIADQPWWAVFEDPALQALIGEALANNYDLQVSAARIAQARALVGVVNSQTKPQIGYRGFAGAEQTFFPDVRGPDTVDVFSVGAVIDATWEFDIWGRIKRQTESAVASLAEQEELRRAVMLTLASDVAAGYFRLIELDRELVIAQESVRAYDETLTFFTKRFEAGRDSRLPVERARANRDGSYARIENIRREMALQENAISVLLGTPPKAIPRGRPLQAQTMPATPVGATTDLLQRRPDIRAAEQVMIRANAEMGVAIAEKFPKLGLGTLLGLTGADIGGDADAFAVANLGLGIGGPIFTGGRLDEIYNNRKAFWDESIALYRRSALTALRETSDALAAQQTLVSRRIAQERQIESLRQSVNLAMTRYEAGRASYFEVLEAQQQLFPAEDALAQTQRDQLLATVSLYKALGGGWNLTNEQFSRPQTVAAAE